MFQGNDAQHADEIQARVDNATSPWRMHGAGRGAGGGGVTTTNRAAVLAVVTEFVWRSDWFHEWEVFFAARHRRCAGLGTASYQLAALTPRP